MALWSEDLIAVDIARTLDGLFVQRVKRSPQRVAYRFFSRPTKQWTELTWAQMGAAVGRWQGALQQDRLDHGDRIAVLLHNGPEWIQFDQAAMGMGLVVVPLYTEDRPENVAYVLRDAAVKLLVIQDVGRWKRLRDALADNPFLQRVVLLEGSSEAKKVAAEDERVVVAVDWASQSDKELRHRRGDPHELASIVYTSGTTGRPKGVMLSHYNMLSVAHASVTVLDVYQEDLFLSFLPLSHTLERTAGYYLPIMAGSTVAYARSVAQLAEDLQTVKPTVLIAVPRVFERVYGRLQDQITRQSPVKRRVFDLAIAIGWRRFLHQQRRGGWHLGFLLWPALKRLVANKMAERLGGRLRATVSGGAPLMPEIARVFIGLGIPLLQGYGLTETGPVISVNPPEDNEPASVGIPLRGIQVRIGSNDELLVKSPGIMLGYWNNHAATVAMINSDGWLHTGDQARIERDHIYITGRIKDILVLSNGEKVPPADMELAIVMDPLFEQVMVVGEGRSYLSALIVINRDLWPGFAQEAGLDPMLPDALEDPSLHHAVISRIRVTLADFPGYAKIRRVTLMLEPWTIENGLLTPTLKVKRALVMGRYASDIDRMYS